MLPDSKETELGGSDQEASSSAGKNTGVVCAWKCVPTIIFSGGDVSEVVSFITTDEFSVRVTKITTRIGVS